MRHSGRNIGMISYLKFCTTPLFLKLMSPRQDSYFDIFDGVKIRESGESSQLENYIKYYLLIKR